MDQGGRLWEDLLGREALLLHPAIHLVGIYADKVDGLCDDGTVLVSHERRFGPERTDSNDYHLSISYQVIS